MKLSISRQLLIGVVLSSSVITCLVTGIHLYQNYQGQIEVTFKKFDALMHSNKRGLETSIWDLNKNQVNAILDGIKSFENTDYLELTYESVEGESKKVRGHLPGEFLNKSYTLLFEENVIGKITLFTDKRHLYNYIVGEFYHVVFFNGLKTFLASFLILFIINRLLTNNIINLTTSLKSVRIREFKGIRLKRFLSKIPLQDEIEYLVNTVNSLLESVKEQADTLEEKVRLRTKELFLAKKKAEIADQAKTTFLANMTHEVRTPLCGISASSELLLEENLDPHQKKLVSIIYDCSQSLLEIVNNVLDLSKIEAGKITIDQREFDLHELLSSIRDLYIPVIKNKKVALALHYPENLPKMFLGDPVRIRQIISNLLNNATKFTPVNGKISLQVAGDMADGSMISVSVADSGTGISPENIGAIFDKYSQGDGSIFNNFGGTGLGLPISRKLAEKMGGGLTVSSELGRGSVFTVSLKLQAAVQKQLKVSDISTIKKYDCSQFSVLIVEDNPVNRDLLISFLKKYKIRPDIAANGKEALDKARENRYHLILMDCQMPVMDGYESARQIRLLKIPHSPKIIALTAQYLKEEEEKCLNSGMDSFFSKPVTSKKIQSIVEGLIFEKDGDFEKSAS